MKLTVNKSVVFVLELKEEEAKWLKDYMQNGMPGEEIKDSAIRGSIFNLLRNEDI